LRENENLPEWLTLVPGLSPVLLESPSRDDSGISSALASPSIL